MEGIDGGVVTISADENSDLIDYIKISREVKKNKNLKVNEYHNSNVSEKIINLIQSYIPIVNKKIWKKYYRVFSFGQKNALVVIRDFDGCYDILCRHS